MAGETVVESLRTWDIVSSILEIWNYLFVHIEIWTNKRPLIAGADPAKPVD